MERISKPEQHNRTSSYQKPEVSKQNGKPICDKPVDDYNNQKDEGQLNNRKLNQNVLDKLPCKGIKNTFLCLRCGKKFTRSSYLKIHRRIHTGETPFSCEFCDQKFRYKQIYLEHIADHKNIKLYQCEICCKIFRRQCTFNLHRRKHFVGKMANTRRYSKKIHLKQSPSQKLQEVLQSEKEIQSVLDNQPLFENVQNNLFKCLICGKMYRKKQYLNLHLKGHEYNNHKKEIYTCSHCSKELTSICELKQHVINHAIDIFQTSINSRTLSAITNSSSDAQAHDLASTDEFASEENKSNLSLSKQKLQILRKSTRLPKRKTLTKPASIIESATLAHSVTDQKSLLNHSDSDNEALLPTEEDASFKDDQLNSTNEESSSELSNSPNKVVTNALYCHVCKVFLSSSKLLHFHMKKHNLSNYICELCGKGYKCEYSLKKHLEKHSGDEEEKKVNSRTMKVSCSQCKKLIRFDCMESHMRTHTGERPYQCEQCGCAFKQVTHLKMHLRIHSGYKPHECTHCGKVFRKSGNLIVHLRNHTGEKPYKCKECGVKIKHLAAYKEHLASHKGIILYQCDLCGHKYKSRSGYDSHKRRHHYNKPETWYKCYSCAVVYQSSEEVKNCSCSGSKVIILDQQTEKLSEPSEQNQISNNDQTGLSFDHTSIQSTVTDSALPSTVYTLSQSNGDLALSSPVHASAQPTSNPGLPSTVLVQALSQPTGDSTQQSTVHTLSKPTVDPTQQSTVHALFQSTGAPAHRSLVHALSKPTVDQLDNIPISSVYSSMMDILNGPTSNENVNVVFVPNSYQS